MARRKGKVQPCCPSLSSSRNGGARRRLRPLQAAAPGGANGALLRCLCAHPLIFISGQRAQAPALGSAGIAVGLRSPRPRETPPGGRAARPDDDASTLVESARLEPCDKRERTEHARGGRKEGEGAGGGRDWKAEKDGYLFFLRPPFGLLAAVRKRGKQPVSRVRRPGRPLRHAHEPFSLRFLDLSSLRSLASSIL